MPGPSPRASPQESSLEVTSAVTCCLLDGEGAPGAGLLLWRRWWGTWEAAPLLTGQLLVGPHSLQQGQRSSKSTPLAGFLLGERRG